MIEFLIALTYVGQAAGSVLFVGVIAGWLLGWFA